MRNGTLFQYFHYYLPATENLWQKLAAEATHLAEAGYTALWLPPATKGAAGPMSVGYDVYDLYDLGEFDQKNGIPTRYGTKDEYIEAVKKLCEAGINVYADIVLNHKGGADETEKVIVKRVNPDNRNEVLGDEFTIEAYTKFTFPGRNGAYSDFIWNSECFSGVDYAADLNETSIFKILNSYGDAWEDGVDTEMGNFDYLMYCDIEFRNNIVREELKKWGLWFCKLTGVKGFRLDAVKHIDYRFYNEWLDIMRHEMKEDLFAVGEYWAPYNLDTMLAYIDKTHGRMSLFDAPLHRNFHVASQAGADFDLRQIFDGSLLQVHPALAVTLVENHDTQPLQSLESPVATWFKPLAYGFILLRQAGYPCIFYPDVYGAVYTDKDHEGNDREIIIEACPSLQKLVWIRSRLAYGEQRDYFDEANRVGWTRSGDDEHPGSGCAVVVANGEGGTKHMEMGASWTGKEMVNALQDENAQVIRVGDDGWADFPVDGGSIAVYTLKAS